MAADGSTVFLLYCGDGVGAAWLNAARAAHQGRCRQSRHAVEAQAMCGSSPEAKQFRKWHFKGSKRQHVARSGSAWRGFPVQREVTLI